MPPEAVVAGLVSIIGTLSGAVVLLWRNHLAADQRERDRTDTLEKRLSEWTEILKRARSR